MIIKNILFDEKVEIQVENISRTFKKTVENIDSLPYRDRFITVLRNINAKFQTDEITGIVGLNGSGKTTLFNILSGNLSYSSGKIRLNDSLINPEISEANSLRISTSSLTSGDTIPGYLNLLEFLNYQTSFKNISSLYEDDISDSEMIESFKKRYESISSSLNVDSRFFLQNISEFSKGMKQKCSLITCLSIARPLYLLDEPTVGLDARSCNSLLSWIKNDKEENHCGYLITSHTTTELLKICDKIYVLDEGCITKCLDVLKLKQNFSTLCIKFNTNNLSQVNITEKTKYSLTNMIKKMQKLSSSNFFDFNIDITNGYNCIDIYFSIRKKDKDKIISFVKNIDWDYLMKKILGLEMVIPIEKNVNFSNDLNNISPIVEKTITHSEIKSNILDEVLI